MNFAQNPKVPMLGIQILSLCNIDDIGLTEYYLLPSQWGKYISRDAVLHYSIGYWDGYLFSRLRIERMKCVFLHNLQLCLCRRATMIWATSV